MRKFFNEQLQSFNDAEVIRLLRLFVAVAFIIILYAAVFSGFQVVDEFEHLHASWLVSTGLVPYKDFFEHHHPLLWYISAPIVKLFYDDVLIFYIMRGFSFLSSVATLYYIYKIALFFGDKRSGWFALALYLGNIITLYNFYQYRPDNFMNLFFIIGLYYLFLAINGGKLYPLAISFGTFSISFLFLQKIALLLLFIEFIVAFLLFIKRMQFRKVLLACIPATVILLTFFYIFYEKDAFLEYFELNYNFNQALVYDFQRGSFWYPNIFLSIYAIGIFSAIYFYKKENLYFKIVAILFVAEFLMRGFYFAPHPNYYTMLTILNALVLSVYINKLMPQRKVICVALCIILFLYLGFLFNKLDANISRHNAYKHYQLAQYVHQSSDKDDMLMNGYDMNYNIYRKDVSYYWFGLDMLFPVMEKEYHLQNKLDINALVIKYKPKFIYLKDYPDLRAYRSYGESKFSQKFIPEIVSMLYQSTPFENLAILK